MFLQSILAGKGCPHSTDRKPGERFGRGQGNQTSQEHPGETGAMRSSVQRLSQPAGQSGCSGQFHHIRSHSLGVEGPEDEGSVPADARQPTEL